VRTSALPMSVAAIALILALAGCTGQTEPAPAASSAIGVPVPSTTETEPAPSPTAADPSVDTAPECETLDLSAGTAAGSDLGPCIQATLARDDTGSLTIDGDELAGTVVYRYDPAFEFRGDLETGGGPVAISFVDGVMMLDDGDGPVVADVDASDTASQAAGSTAEVYRIFADPGFIGDLVGAGESWTVSDAPEEVETADGGSVEAYRIESPAAYSWYDIPIDSYTLWMTADGRPVATESTTDLLGRTSTLTQRLTGFGEPVTVSPLS